MNTRFETPGAIDIHTHLREPSSNTSETIESGTRAALLGGFVLVADMPNNPGIPVWSKERLDAKIEIAKRSAWIPTAFYAGSQPEEDNIGELAKMAPSAIGLKLYGGETTNNTSEYEAKDFRDIIREWHRVAPTKPIMFHSGDNNLPDMIDLAADEYSHPLHVCHVNDMDQVDQVIDAKAQERAVTCGVCTHHMLKTSHDVHTQGAFAEMKPKLAHQDEAERLLDALENGAIDIVETDFAPHSVQAKYDAENSGGHCYGVPGIEHVLPLLFYQVHRGRLSFERLIEATHDRPADILGVRFNDTGVIWNNETGIYRIGEEDIEAMCGWTPYLGMLAIGRIEYVQIGGRTAVAAEDLYHKQPEIVTQRGQIIG